jgi:5'-deoxynucleotidase YfbR-like HD superfamily hydrolase
MMFLVIIVLESVLRTLTSNLQKEERWKTRRPHVSRENVLWHTFKQTIIVLIMNAAEKHAGNPHNLDFYWLLQCAFTHDLGESIVGDVSRLDKTADDEAREEKGYQQVMTTLVPWFLLKYFPQPIDRDPQASQNMKEFWEAAEFIGYVMFALEEAKNTSYPEEARATWRGIADYYRADLKKAATKFAGVRLFVEGLYS